MPLSYGDVLDRYQRAKAFGETRSMPEFAQSMNQTFGTQDYSAGLRDGWWTRASHVLDREVFNPIAEVTTAPLFEGIGGAFGEAEAGRKVGMGLPRMGAEIALSAIPVVGPGLTATAMGAHTYADTGSYGQAAISGLTALAIPGAGELGGSIGARLMGGSKVSGDLLKTFADVYGKKVFNQILPETAADAAKVGMGRFFGSQAGMIGANVVGTEASSVKRGNGLTNPFSADFLMTQIPFSILDASRIHLGGSGGPEALTRGAFQNVTARGAREMLVPKTEPVLYVPKTGTPKAEAGRTDLIAAFDAVATNPTSSPEQQSTAVQAVIDGVNGKIVKGPEKSILDPDVHVNGIGIAQENGSYKIIVNPALSHPDVVAQLETHQNVFVNDTKEPAFQPDGSMTFNVKKSQLQGLKDSKYSVTNPLKPEDLQGPVEEQTPEIPPRPADVGPTSPSGGPEDALFADENKKGQPSLPTRPEGVQPTTLQGPPAIDPTKPEYGQTNTIFTPDAAEAARQRIRERLKNTSTGVDPTVLADVITLGGYHFEAGLRTFGRWSAQMIKEVGNVGDDVLQRAWQGIVSHYEKFPADEQRTLKNVVGIEPQAIMPHGVSQEKDTPLLDMLQGEIRRDQNGKVVRLGNTDVAKDGTMNVVRFQKSLQVAEPLMQFLRENHPEVFLGDKVDARKALDALRNGVKWRVLDGNESANDKVKELSRISHELDTFNPDWPVKSIDWWKQQDEQIKILHDKFVELQALKESKTQPESATARFGVTPYSPEQRAGTQEVAPGHTIVQVVDLVGQLPWDPTLPKGESRGVRFTSNHYQVGDAGKNQLFFARGALHEYQPGAKLPDGTLAKGVRRIFEVWEVQSDWAGEVTKAKERNKERLGNVTKDVYEKNGSWIFTTENGRELEYETKEGAELARQRAIDSMPKVNTSPLLPLYETLALRTAILEARKMGADAIALSDAQSAMMTEGHDKQDVGWDVKWPAAGAIENQRFPTRESAERVAETLRAKGLKPEVIDNSRPSQASGMTAAYDQRLPKGLEALTGVKGVKGVMGEVHEGARTREPFIDAVTGEEKPGEFGSPVFREKNASGELVPKVTNNALIFDLSKVNGGLSQDASLALKEAVQKIEQTQARLQAAKKVETVVPQTVQDWQKLVPEPPTPVEGKTATSVLQDEVLKKNTPEIDEAQQLLEVQKREAELIAKGKADLHVLRWTKANETLQYYMEQDVEDMDDEQLAEHEESLQKAEKEFNDAEKSLDEYKTELAQSGSEKVVSDAEKTKFDYAFKNEDGSRRNFKPEDKNIETAKKMADEWLLANGFVRDGDVYRNTDKSDTRKYYIRNAGSDRDPQTYVAPALNEKASLDAEHGEGVTLLRLIPADEPSSFPEPSKERYLKQIDRAIANPLGFAAENKLEVPDAFRILGQAKIAMPIIMDGGSFADVNAALGKAGKKLFESKQVMKDTMFQVSRGVNEWRRKNSLLTLDSRIPMSPEVEKLMGEIGFDKGTRAVADWIVAQKIPVVSDFVALYSKFPNVLDQIQFLMPGGRGFMHSMLAYVQDGLGGSFINVGTHPDSVEREDVVDYAGRLAHEFQHHMEKDLSVRTDPAAEAYKQARKNVQEQVSQSLLIPAKVRAFIKKARAENMYARMTTENGFDLSKEFVKFVGPELSQWSDRMYGLLDPGELMTQALTHQPLAELLNKVKVRFNGVFKPAIDWLSSFFNKALGGEMATDGALKYILNSFSDYMTAGVLRRSYGLAEYFHDKLIHDVGVRSDALASQLHALDGMYAKGGIRDGIMAFIREGENNLLPATTYFGRIDQPLRAALISGTPKQVHDSGMDLLAADIPQHKALLERLQSNVATIKGAYAEVKAGRVPRAVIPELAEQRLARSEESLHQLELALKKQDMDVNRFNALNNFTPEGWEDTLADQLVGASIAPSINPTPNEGQARAVLTGQEITRTAKEELEKGKFQKGMEGVQKWLYLSQHFARAFPAVKPIEQSVQGQQASAKERFMNLMTAYVFNPMRPLKDGTLGSRDPDIKANNDRVATTPALERAASNIRLLAQVANKEGRDFSLNDPAVQEVLRKLQQPADRAAVVQEWNSSNSMHQQGVKELTKYFHEEHNPTQVARVVAMHNPDMPVQKAREVAQGMYEAMRLLSDPATAMQGSEALKGLAGQVSAESFPFIVNHANGLLTATNKFLSIVEKNPHFASEQRFDKWHLRMITPDGKPFRTSSDNPQVLQKRNAELTGQGYQFFDFLPKENADAPGLGMTDDAMKAFQELDNQSAARLMEALKGVDPEIMAAVLPETQRAAEYQAAMTAFAPVPGMSRTLAAGREYINTIKNNREFWVRTNNWMRHKQLRAETQLLMLDPEIAGNRSLKNWSEQHVENFLTPDNPIARAIVSSTYFYHLAFNLGNSLLESVQNLTTGMSSLIAETGSVSDAFGQTMKSIKQIQQHFLTSKWDNVEHEALIKQAERRGIIRADWHDHTDNDSADWADTERPWYAATAKKGANLLYTGARGFTTFFTQYNDKIGLLASYDIAREKGMSVKEATAFATDLKNRGYYTGGKAQRAVGLWSIKSKPVPQIMSSLTTYTFGWFGQMATDFKVGFGNAPKGTTETQRLGAKKAFIYGLAAQAALAGALGLPGVGQGLALLQQATGLDLKGKVREFLADSFDEDSATGGMMTNMALRGMISAGTPIDPSNRASISIPFIGVDSQKGADLANLLGAPGATLVDAVKGATALARGDMHGFTQMLPSVMQKPVRLWQDDGDIRDKRGALIYKLNPADQYMQALGLTPTRIQNMRDTADAVKKANDNAAQQKQALVDNLAALANSGNVNAVLVKLREMKQQNPDEDYEGLVKAIAARQEAINFQFDWRRSLNPGAQIGLLTSRLPSQELQRRKFREQAQQAMGLQTLPSPLADLHAGLRDQLMDSDPYMTPQEARAALPGQKPKRDLLNLQMPSGYQ